MNCETCGRALEAGDDAWETEWKQIDTTGGAATVRLVKKYECAPSCGEVAS